jgi:hypothetical protein
MTRLDQLLELNKELLKEMPQYQDNAVSFFL